MECTIVYGLGSDIKRQEVLPASEAFRRLQELKRKEGWLFYNVFYHDRLVYTTQDAAGYRYICGDCPYSCKSKTVTSEQYDAIYGG